MRLRNGERTIAELITSLRRMQGHLGRRDREHVVDAIEAIYELGERLARAEGRLKGLTWPDGEPPARTPGDLTITRAAEDEDRGEEAASAEPTPGA